MGVFKSKEEKRMERTMEIKRGVAEIKRNIKKLHQHERDWLVKARRARKMSDKDQFEFLKKQLKKTAVQKRLRERQLLSLETALQIKNQAEADVEFAESMNSMSKAMMELYGSVNMGKIQMNFQKAMNQAETMKERMDIFLDAINESFTSDVEGADDLVSDKEIDRLIEEEVVHEEKGAADADIEKGLKDLEGELGK